MTTTDLLDAPSYLFRKGIKLFCKKSINTSASTYFPCGSTFTAIKPSKLIAEMTETCAPR